MATQGGNKLQGYVSRVGDKIKSSPQRLRARMKQAKSHFTKSRSEESSEELQSSRSSRDSFESYDQPNANVDYWELESARQTEENRRLVDAVTPPPPGPRSPTAHRSILPVPGLPLPWNDNVVVQDAILAWRHVALDNGAYDVMARAVMPVL
jgi:hypothetical protein